MCFLTATLISLVSQIEKTGTAIISILIKNKAHSTPSCAIMGIPQLTPRVGILARMPIAFGLNICYNICKIMRYWNHYEIRAD